MNNTFELKGFQLNDSSQLQAIDELEALIDSGQPGYICFCEANLLKSALNDKRVTDILIEASLVYPDGKVLQMLAKVHHDKDIQRVTGPNFILNACDKGQAKKWRHFFYGGSEGVADKLAENLQTMYPDMIVAGTYCPPFKTLTDKEEGEIKEIIEKVSPDLLWVALGGPKQEIWMNEHLNTINVPVMLGVGAAFDFHSGNRPWAPHWIRLIGMEWLYRTIFGGKTTFFRNLKCVTVTGFVLISDYVKHKILKLH